jgi:hypothetical protein
VAPAAIAAASVLGRSVLVSREAELLGLARIEIALLTPASASEFATCADFE